MIHQTRSLVKRAQLWVYDREGNAEGGIKGGGGGGRTKQEEVKVAR